MAAVFGAIIVTVVGGLVWFNHREVSKLAEQEASARFAAIAQQVRRETQALLAAATIALDTTALTAGTQAPPDAMASTLLAILRSIKTTAPSAMALEIGRADGSIVLVQRGPARDGRVNRSYGNEAYSAEFVEPAGSGMTLRWISYDASGRELRRTDPAPTSLDARQRPWYQAALGQSTTVTIPPYRFVNVPEIGITIARTAQNDPGAVFGLDVTLANLDQALEALQSWSRQDLAIFADNGTLVARADALAGDMRPDTTDALPNLATLGSPSLAALYAAYRREGKGRDLTFVVEGRSYLARVEAAMPGTGLVIGLAMPAADVLGPADSLRLKLLALGLAAILAAALIGAVAAGSLIRPLRRVTDDLAWIMAFRLAGTVPGRSRIREIRDLSSAVVTLDLALQNFTRYVPGQIVRSIVTERLSPRLGGIRQPVTVLFTDVSGFTPLAESLTPEALMAQMSRYFEVLGTELIASGATIDKYIGDSIMVFWNAPETQPNHVARACAGALAAAARIERLNEVFRAEGLPLLPTRFGLHTGEAVVGHVGSADRINYTVLGLTVNIAARLEALNKIYGTTILVSDAVRQATQEAFDFMAVDTVTVRGTRAPLRIHSLIGPAKV
jgi:adenylate cyclase